MTGLPSIREHDTVMRGLRIHWAECGEGDRTFLLVHGLGSSIAKWVDSMPHLARGGRVVAFDLPGFGGSESPAGPYTPEWLAGSIRMFADELGIDRPVVVANSLGGLVAVCFAAAWPDRARALVALAPTMPAPPGAPADIKMLLKFGATLIPGISDLAYAGYIRFQGPRRFVMSNLKMNVLDEATVSPATIERLVSEAEARISRPEVRRNMMTATRALALRMIFGRDRVGRYVDALRLPVLYMWGEHDSLVSPDVGAGWAARTASGSVELIPGVAHNPQIEAPEAFASAVLAWVDKLDGAA